MLVTTFMFGCAGSKESELASDKPAAPAPEAKQAPEPFVDASKSNQGTKRRLRPARGGEGDAPSTVTQGSGSTSNDNPFASTPRVRETPVDEGMAETGRALFGGSTKAGASGAMDAHTHWTVAIHGFDALTEATLARDGLQKVRTLGQLPDARLDKRGDKLMICYGLYASPEDPQAQADLHRIKSIEIDGGTPFMNAILAPPEAATGANPAHDLSRVRDLYGKDAMYTLQIGTYTWDPGSPPEAIRAARQAAEDAVKQLRQENQSAYFYHGVNSSLVTIGVFGPEDHDPQNPLNQSMTLTAMRKKYPHNLVNGKGARQRVQGKADNDPNAWRMMPSILVNIPK